MSAGVGREKENLRTSMEWMEVFFLFFFLFYMLQFIDLRVIKILLLYTHAGACTAFL